MSKEQKKKNNNDENIDDLEISVLSPNIKTKKESNEDSNKKKVSRLSHTTNNLRGLEKEDLIKLLITSDKTASEQDSIVFEMRTLLQSGKGLGDILNLNQLLSTFMSIVRERYDVENSCVLLIDDIDPNNVKFRVRAFYGIPSTYWRDQYEEEVGIFSFPIEDGLLWQILKQGEVFSVQTYKGLPRFKVAWEKYYLRILHSDIWVPLIKKGEVKGILTTGLKKDGTQIPESERVFLQDLASIAVTNIDSVLKYEKNETILRNVKTLYDVNQQLTNVNDFKELCLDSLSTAVEALDAQKGNLMLFNETTNELELKVVWGALPKEVLDKINSGEMKTKSFKIGEGVAGLSAQLKKPILENDRTKIVQVGKNIVHSMLTVPLIRGDKVVGVINMTNKVKTVKGKKELDTIGRFTEDDQILLMGLADQAASNLHKARLYSASITDKLTGLFNTRQFEIELEEEIEKSISSDEDLCLSIIDIDFFKKFNDNYGHKAGDLVLIEVAKKLKETSFLEKAISFRYGGEEFCLILPKTDIKKATKIMEQFRSKIESTTIEYEKKSLKVTCSIGIASFTSDVENSKNLFLRADATLYKCKENGRNQVQTYADSKNKNFIPKQKKNK